MFCGNKLVKLVNEIHYVNTTFKTKLQSEAGARMTRAGRCASMFIIKKFMM